MSESNTPRRIIPILLQGRVAVAAGNGLEFRHALPLSLYVHIPWCVQKCPYCDFNSHEARGGIPEAEYIAALIADLESALPLVWGRKVSSIFFGGGTPSLLSGEALDQLLTAIRMRLPLLPEAEITLEANPGTVEADKFAAFRAAGINRLSLGIQSFNPAHLKALGRIHDGDEARRAIEIAAAHFDNFNLDLMYGLPGQTPGDLEATLLRAVELGADRIALFGYAHVPHMIARQKRIDGSNLPSQEDRFAMAWLGHELLTGAGYQPIGFDHFALPGDPMAKAARKGQLHRNFQGFTEDPAPVLLGLGATAISNFPGAIIQNEKNAGRYRMRLSQRLLPAGLGVLRSPRDQAIGRVIESLLCHGSAQLGAVKPPALAEALDSFIARGLAQFDGETLKILPDGLPYARTIAALFDPYRQDSLRRFSSAV